MAVFLRFGGKAVIRRRYFHTNPNAVDLIATLSAAEIFAGRVNDMAEALAMQRTPIDPDGSGMRRPPPRLGEHTREIRAELDGPTTSTNGKQDDAE